MAATVQPPDPKYPRQQDDSLVAISAPSEIHPVELGVTHVTRLHLTQGLEESLVTKHRLRPGIYSHALGNEDQRVAGALDSALGR